MILSLSSSSDMALLLVVDSRSGAPAVGVPVVLYDNNDNRVAAAVTDTMGICRMAIEMNRSYRAFVMDGEDRFAPPVTEYRQEFFRVAIRMYLSLLIAQCIVPDRNFISRP